MPISRREFNSFLVSLAGGGLAASALAACGSESGNSGSGSGGKSGPAITYASHDELLAAAQKETGTLTAITQFTENANKQILDGFLKKYSWAKASLTAQSNDGVQKALLELQAGRVKDDVLEVGTDLFDQYLPYVADYDMLALSKAGVVNIPEGMICPTHPNIYAQGSGAGGIVWNKNLVAEEDVPKTYEDFLDPKWKGKFMCNVEGAWFGALQEDWGEQKTVDYATKVAQNKPIWTNSDTAGLTQLAAGGAPLYLLPNIYSALRLVEQKGATNVGTKVIEPVPVRLVQISALHKITTRPATALVYFEYVASAEAQAIIDKYEPDQSSLFVPGTYMAKLTTGKKLASDTSWKNISKRAELAKGVQKAWGFPTAK